MRRQVLGTPEGVIIARPMYIYNAILYHKKEDHRRPAKIDTLQDEMSSLRGSPIYDMPC